ncbi:MAG: hypothetical protein HQL84_10880 [Magnetococcales bacterium]|nr:hypothetical protein [Magnetococcales bacterium]MBF0150536.1 hypothetical protein [Magnetococcales bacterium]
MEFIPLYYQDKLDLINPEGDVGIVTLWSPIKVVKDHVAAAHIDLDPSTSRIAVIGTLYGEGLPELLRNLLYNPQLNHLLLFGVDLGRSREHLLGFFQHGLELTTCLGASVHQIVGTLHKMDGAIQPWDFHDRLNIVDGGTPAMPGAAAKIIDFFAGLPPQKVMVGERRSIPMPTLALTRFPSDPRSHTILAHTPMEAWKELIFRLYRFGHRVDLGRGEERIELQTVKATILHPREESDAVLREHGFSLGQFQEYQRRILDSELPPNQHYGYGHRLRRYFGHGDPTRNADTLARAIVMLRDHAESRHVYIALWDTARDLLIPNEGHPCLVSLFFRKFDQHLTLTAVFRTHNALRAWPENVYGLIAIQRHVSQAVAMVPGAITLISHSISIDPQGNGLDRAQAICEFRNRERMDSDYFKPDPHGDFLVSVDEEQAMIVVDHRFEGQRLHRYSGQSAEALERQLAADLALSDIAHALYLGRELGRAEARLQKHRRRSEKT